MAPFLSFICRQRLTGVLAAFLCISFSTSTVRADSPQQESDGPDTKLFRSVNDAQTSFKTSLFGITDNSVAVIVVGLPLGCLVYGLAAKNNDVVTTGLLLSASEVLTYGAKYVIKSTVKRARPYEVLSGVTVNDIESADPYSFPSGHTAGAFALATLLTLRYPRPYVYVPAFIWAGYNGLHYPSDALGGAVLGAGSSFLTYALRGTIVDVFDSVTGRTPDAESSVIVMPLPQGLSANIHVVF
jgi:membrane-associated phospholipid phosphatase